MFRIISVGARQCCMFMFFRYISSSVITLLAHNAYIFFLQIVFSLLFSIIIAFVSDALSSVPNKASVLSSDASFRNEFQDTVSDSTGTSLFDAYMHFVNILNDLVILV